MSALVEADQQGLDLEAARRDVVLQREIDQLPQRSGWDALGQPFRPRPPSWDLVEARMLAALRARREADDESAVRQSLIDLGAVCEELAATYPVPHIPARSERGRT